MLFFPTVDEDVQYFRSQGYTGSINDMHFKAMGDLGYTGSLNDRIHAYLTFKYGSYYAAMRDLRNGTSVFSLISAYAVNGFDPALVFDFKGNYFRKSATASTFPASITHAASTNATMTDGYGPEVVTNGKFGTDTAGWASGASAATSAAVSGEMQVTNVSSNGRVVTAIPTVVGRRYEVSGVGRVISGTAGKAASLYLTNNFGTTIQSGTINYTTTDAPLGLFFTATATTSYISAITFGSVGNVSAFDNVSVRESPVLKWRPHNLLKNSGDVTTGGWVQQIGVTSTATGSPFGSYQSASPTSTSSTEAQSYQIGKPLTSGVTYVAWSLAKYSAGNGWFSVSLYDTGSNNNRGWFDLQNGVVGSKDTTLIDHGMIDYGDGWWLCWVSKVTASTSGGINLGVTTADGATDGNSGDVILIAGSQLNRNDLGGMVNNPDTSSSYVPTTTTNLYLSRRGHHIYNGSAWVNEGILHESEARTNLVTNSGDLTGAGWTGTMTLGTVTAGSPFGTYQTISPTQNNSNLGTAQRYQIGKPLTSGSTYVGWSLVKYSAGSGWFVIRPYDTVNTGQRAYFDLQNGVVGSKDTLIIDHGMVDYGDGWWLCWASRNATSTSGGFVAEMPNGDDVLNCSAADVILIAGSQFELGSTPSSYIPTTTTVTRAAETLTVPAANLPYDSTNMSIQMDGKMTYADNGITGEVQYYRWLLNSTNYIASSLSTLTGRAGQVGFSQRQSTSGYDFVVGTNTDYSPNTDVPFNLAVRNGPTFINGAHEGTLLTANTTPTILPDLSATDLILGSILMGTIGQFRMWSDDLGDVGITEATLPSTEPSLSLTFDGSETSFTVLDWSE